MLLECAIGDAYGLGFEYRDENLRLNDPSKGYVSRDGKQWVLGHYSDDGQMSIGIAELLVEGKLWEPLNIATKFVEVFKRDPIHGYARGFFDFLNQVRNGQEFLARIRPGSDKSGAAMRATPLGVLASKDKVIEYAIIQGKLTHDTPDGLRSACAAALTTHYFLHEKGMPLYLPKYIAENVGHGDYEWDQPYEGKVGSKGHMSVRAAITAIASTTSMTECLKRCIAFGGDVDTVATIAMAAASCCEIYTKDLPPVLFYMLRNDKYGRTYLEELDKKLMALVKR